MEPNLRNQRLLELPALATSHKIVKKPEIPTHISVKIVHLEFSEGVFCVLSTNFEVARIVHRVFLIWRFHVYLRFVNFRLFWGFLESGGAYFELGQKSKLGDAFVYGLDVGW
jgi:hypothetical protein